MSKNEILKNLSVKFNRFGLHIKKHSPEILMIAGIVGTVTSAVIACKATTKVSAVLEKSKEEINKIHESDEKGYIENESKSVREDYSHEDYQKDLTIMYVKTAVELAKLYSPAIILGALSITSILASNNILRKRNVAIMAAYTAVDKGFKDYRKRVIERFGKEVDRELKFNIREETITETTIDENGKEQTVEKIVKVCDKDNSQTHRIFDAGNPLWEKDSDHNLFTLNSIQNYANDLLRARGHVFLNEVYDQLGFERTSIGQVIGWIYDPENPNHTGDNYIDFGIHDMSDERKRAFYEGSEYSIWLDFNVDGIIYNLI